MRQFVQVAHDNPKVYAELLFYKTLREANDLESNYDGEPLAEYVFCPFFRVPRAFVCLP